MSFKRSNVISWMRRRAVAPIEEPDAGADEPCPVPRQLLEELPDRSVFRFNERVFVKGPQLRKRYKYHCLNDRRNYIIDPLAEVQVHGPMVVQEAT